MQSNLPARHFAPSISVITDLLFMEFVCTHTKAGLFVIFPEGCVHVYCDA